MKKIKKYFIGALAMSFCVATASGVLAINASADNQQLSALTQDNYAVNFASIRYTTASDDNSGIRFSIRMDKSVYETITAIEGVTLGAKLLPADLVTGALDVDTEGAQTAITYGVGADAENPTEVASTWGVAADDETKMEAIVYIYDIDSVSYNRDIAIVAYATVGEEEFYTAQVSESVSEVAVKLLEADETAAEADKLTTEQKAELEGFLNEYQVNFYDEDGTTVLYSETHTYGDVVEVPTIEGYTIESWFAYDGTDYASEATTIGASITVKSNLQYKVSEKYIPVYAAVSNTTVTRVTTAQQYTINDVTFDNFYPGQSLVYTATYNGDNSYDSTGAAKFKLTGATAAPAGTTTVEIYVKATAFCYNGNKITDGTTTQNLNKNSAEWTVFSYTVEEYNAMIANGTEFSFGDHQGNGKSGVLLISEPVFIKADKADYAAVSNTTVTRVTTAQQYTISGVTFDNFYPGQSLVYTATYNGDNSYNSENAAKFKLTGATAAPVGTTTVEIYVKASAFCYNGNKITDGTTTQNLNKNSAEWTMFSYTVEEYNAMIANGTEFSFGDNQGNGKSGVLLISEPVFIKADYVAVSNTTVTRVTTAQQYTINDVTFDNFYPGQSLVYVATYNGDNSYDSTGAAKFKLTGATAAPADTATVEIYVKATAFCYNGNKITDGTTTQNLNKNSAEWTEFTYTVEEYNAMIANGTEFSFGDNQGNGKSGVLLISEPIFS